MVPVKKLSLFLTICVPLCVVVPFIFSSIYSDLAMASVSDYQYKVIFVQSDEVFKQMDAQELRLEKISHFNTGLVFGVLLGVICLSCAILIMKLICNNQSSIKKKISALMEPETRSMIVKILVMIFVTYYRCVIESEMWTVCYSLLVHFLVILVLSLSSWDTISIQSTILPWSLVGYIFTGSLSYAIYMQTLFSLFDFCFLRTKKEPNTENEKVVPPKDSEENPSTKKNDIDHNTTSDNTSVDNSDVVTNEKKCETNVHENVDTKEGKIDDKEEEEEVSDENESSGE